MSDTTLVKGTIVNKESGVRIPGIRGFNSETEFDFRIDGNDGHNRFFWSEWTFEVAAPTPPDKPGIFLFYSYGLDDDGELSNFPNILVHLRKGPDWWVAIGNAEGDSWPLKREEVEKKFATGKIVRLTLPAEEVSE